VNVIDNFKRQKILYLNLLKMEGDFLTEFLIFFDRLESMFERS